MEISFYLYCVFTLYCSDCSLVFTFIIAKSIHPVTYEAQLQSLTNKTPFLFILHRIKAVFLYLSFDLQHSIDISVVFKHRTELFNLCHVGAACDGGGGG